MTKHEFEVLIGLTYDEAMMIQFALKELGKAARVKSNDEDQDDFYRESWAEYIPRVAELYLAMSNQIEKHDTEYS